MSKEYRAIDGSVYVDDRPTLEEWVSGKCGKFGHVLEFEIRTTDAEEELWVLLRTDTEWEPRWSPVDENVLLTLKQKSEIETWRMTVISKPFPPNRVSGPWRKGSLR